MPFRVLDLPRIDKRTVRVFSLRPLDRLKKMGTIPLREGLSKDEVAKKLGVKSEALMSFGISDKDINVKVLGAALQNNVLKIDFRAGDETIYPENILHAVLGRIGNEKEVFEPFNIVVALKDKKIPDQHKPEILASYLKTLVLNEPSRLIFAVETVKDIFYDDNISSVRFLMKIAGHFYSEMPDFVDFFAKCAGMLCKDLSRADEILFNAGNAISTGEQFLPRFLLCAATKMSPDRASRDEIVVKMVNRRYEQNIGQFSEILINIAKETNPDPASQEKFLLDFIKNKLDPSLEEKKSFVLGVARKMFDDKQEQWAFICKAMEEIFSGKGSLLASMARAIFFADQAAQDKAVIAALRSLHSSIPGLAENTIAAADWLFEINIDKIDIQKKDAFVFEVAKLMPQSDIIDFIGHAAMHYSFKRLECGYFLGRAAKLFRADIVSQGDFVLNAATLFQGKGLKDKIDLLSAAADEIEIDPNELIKAMFEA